MGCYGVPVRYDQLKSGDQFTIGGMLYAALTDYNAETDSINVAVYMDYPHGGFKGSYALTKMSESEDEIMLQTEKVW